MNSEVWKQETRNLAGRMAKERKLKTDEILLLERFIMFGAHSLEQETPRKLKKTA